MFLSSLSARLTRSRRDTERTDAAPQGCYAKTRRRFHCASVSPYSLFQVFIVLLCKFEQSNVLVPRALAQIKLYRLAGVSVSGRCLPVPLVVAIPQVLQSEAPVVYSSIASVVAAAEQDRLVTATETLVKFVTGLPL
jgi:hypothetical protein